MAETRASCETLSFVILRRNIHNSGALTSGRWPVPTDPSFKYGDGVKSCLFYYSIWFSCAPFVASLYIMDENTTKNNTNSPVTPELRLDANVLRLYQLVKWLRCWPIQASSPRSWLYSAGDELMFLTLVLHHRPLAHCPIFPRNARTPFCSPTFFVVLTSDHGVEVRHRYRS